MFYVLQGRQIRVVKLISLFHHCRQQKVAGRKRWPSSKLQKRKKKRADVMFRITSTFEYSFINKPALEKVLSRRITEMQELEGNSGVQLSPKAGSLQQVTQDTQVILTVLLKLLYRKLESIPLSTECIVRKTMCSISGKKNYFFI